MMLRLDNAGGGYTGVTLFSIVFELFHNKKWAWKKSISPKGTNIHNTKKTSLSASIGKWVTDFNHFQINS